jgi:hypothetical protein
MIMASCMHESCHFDHGRIYNANKTRIVVIGQEDDLRDRFGVVFVAGYIAQRGSN